MIVTLFERIGVKRGFAAAKEAVITHRFGGKDAVIDLSDEQAEELAHWLNKELFGIRVLVVKEKTNERPPGSA